MKPQILMLVAMLCSVEALAKLPPPTPEEAAKKQIAAEKKVKDEDAAKEALAKAQDRVAQRYRAIRKNAPLPVPVVAPATKK
ncbi:MAG TPA: formate dehydrogenase [Novimethylophilus sp.]|jgi:hypothetical protein|uniref:formate dehydrogenase n=1 Tax=Novimethylophilus sp. TaxID=2137426 RepID=UPI002F428E87